MSKIASFLNDESGASAAEYALILAIIGTVIVTALTGLATDISAAIGRAGDVINPPAA
jgi:pilus assembly protein Flp/PilA